MDEELSASRNLERRHSVGSFFHYRNFSSEFEKLVYFDPLNSSQCLPARSSQLWRDQKATNFSLNENPRARKSRSLTGQTSSTVVAATREQRTCTCKAEGQEDFLPVEAEKPTQQDLKLLSGESNIMSCTDVGQISNTKSVKTALMHRVADEQEHRHELPERTSAESWLEHAEQTAEEAKPNAAPGANHDHETKNLGQNYSACPEDIKKETIFSEDNLAKLPFSPWNEIDGSELEALVHIQERRRLQHDREAIVSLHKKIAVCQEQNYNLKNDNLGLQTVITQREYAIERMKTVIDDLSQERDDMMSELSMNQLRIQQKVGVLVAEIKTHENREKEVLNLLKEVSGSGGTAFKDVTDKNSRVLEYFDHLRETFKAKDNAIPYLKKQLADATKEGVENSEIKLLEKTLEEAKSEHKNLLDEYQASLREWEKFQCQMEKENQKLCSDLDKIIKEKESLENDLLITRKDLEGKFGEVENYKRIIANKETEIYETRKTMEKYKLETQHSLSEMEDEMHEIRKQNDESFSLLGIATGDLKILRKRNKELEEAFSAKKLEQQPNADVLDELKSSDEDLKMATTQLEKYSEVLTEIEGLSQRCGKLTRINAELEDNIVSLTEKNETLIEDNRRLYDELESGLAKVQKLCEKSEESENEKSELFQMVNDLSESKRALAVEVEELKASLQLALHENQALLPTGGAGNHNDNLKLEIDNLDEEFRKRDLQLLSLKEEMKARELSKENEMAKNYECLSFELEKIVIELKECRADGIKDTETYKSKLSLLKQEKSSLVNELNERKQAEVSLKNVIKELQDMLLEQEERFKTDSLVIFQETEEARKRIADIEAHYQERLSEKRVEVSNLDNVNNELTVKLREFGEVICALRNHEKRVCKSNGLLKRQKKSLKLKLDKVRKLEKSMSEKIKASEKRVQSLLSDVIERDTQLEDLKTAERTVAEVEKAMNTHVENLSRCLQEARDENVSLKTQIQTQHKNIQFKEEKLKDMKQTIKSLKKSTILQTDKCNELIKDLSREKESKNSMKDKANTKINSLYEQLQAMETRYADLKRRNEDTDKLHAELKVKLKEEQEKCELFKRDLKEKEILQEKTCLELSKLHDQYDDCQRQLKEKVSVKNDLHHQLKSFVTSQNRDLMMEVRRSHSNVIEVIHESKMGELRSELIEMKRKGALRREIAMSTMGSKSCMSIRCS